MNWPRLSTEVPWLGYSCQTPNHKQLRKISRPTRHMDEDFLPSSLLSFFLPPFSLFSGIQGLMLTWQVLPLSYISSPLGKDFQKTIYYYTSSTPVLPLIICEKAFESLLHQPVCVEITERNYCPLLCKDRMPYNYV